MSAAALPARLPQGLANSCVLLLGARRQPGRAERRRTSRLPVPPLSVPSLPRDGVQSTHFV
eukprot:5907529-Pyramimonas_sp.AAC.1